jgi:putative Holliday junction resolvase
MGRVMAVDYGSRRIGIALSDPLRMTAHTFKTISWNGKDLAYALNDIFAIVKDKDVTEIVIGRPARTDGKVSDSQQKAEAFGNAVSGITGIEPMYIDEKYTTVIASRFMQETGVSGKKKKEMVDQFAAQIMLREYLEIHRLEK